ncbi:mRNA capping enzyme adenylation domain-containing protein [Entamoeba marina]
MEALQSANFFDYDEERSFQNDVINQINKYFSESPTFVDVELGVMNGGKFGSGIDYDHYELLQSILKNEFNATEEKKEEVVDSVIITKSESGISQVTHKTKEEFVETESDYTVCIRFVEETYSQEVVNKNKQDNYIKYTEHRIGNDESYDLILHEQKKYVNEDLKFLQYRFFYRIHYSKMAKEVVDSLFQFVERFQLVNPMYFGDLNLKKQENELKEPQECHRNIFASLGISQSSRFPGWEPLLFNRKYYNSLWLDSLNHHQTPEDNEKYVFLVDEEFKTFSIEYQELKTLFGENNTILDGMMVRNLNTLKPSFICFDIIQLKGNILANKSFEKRVESIRDGVILPYREELTKKSLSESQLPFSIYARPVYSNRQLDILTNKCIFQTPTGIYFNDGKRHHRTVGIVMIPNAPYLSDNKYAFEWKFPDTLDINFLIKEYVNRGSREDSLFCMPYRENGSAPTFLQTVNFLGNDRARYEGDKRRYQVDKGVVECSYDSKSGLWKYKKFRADLKEPDHISLVVNILETIAAGVTLEELVICIPNPGFDRYWKEIQEIASQKVLKDSLGQY